MMGALTLNRLGKFALTYLFPMHPFKWVKIIIQRKLGYTHLTIRLPRVIRSIPNMSHIAQLKITPKEFFHCYAVIRIYVILKQMLNKKSERDRK